MVWSLAVAIMLVLAHAAVGAEPLDGTYTGTLSCPAFPNQTPLRTAIAVTVSGGVATYEREIVTPAAPGGAGTYERGKGTVTPAGAIALSGGCEGGFSCVTEYRGNLRGSPIKLTGTQRWWFRSGDRERACDIELKRARP